MKRITFLFAATILVGAAPMFAVTQTGTIAVSANVVKTCSLVTNPLAFGAYDTLTGTAVSAQADIVVQCTKGDGISLDLDAGLGTPTTGTSRAMMNGAANLDYEIYTDGAHSTLWTSPLNIGAAPSKDARTFTVYGEIPANQDVVAGSYTDTINVTLNY